MKQKKLWWRRLREEGRRDGGGGVWALSFPAALHRDRQKEVGEQWKEKHEKSKKERLGGWSSSSSRREAGELGADLLEGGVADRQTEVLPPFSVTIRLMLNSSLSWRRRSVLLLQVEVQGMPAEYKDSQIHLVFLETNTLYISRVVLLPFYLLNPSKSIQLF